MALKQRAQNARALNICSPPLIDIRADQLLIKNEKKAFQGQKTSLESARPRAQNDRDKTRAKIEHDNAIFISTIERSNEGNF